MIDPVAAEAPETPEASDPPASLEVRLHALLTGRARATVATAESCTGGGVAARITAVAGSSAYFLGGVVAYANAAKSALLGVPVAILNAPGAVSEPCARAMAEGARRVFMADFAVATTGIAGPGGGTSRKPVGLVFVAVAGPDGTVTGAEYRFRGDRTAVVVAATDAALQLLVARVEAVLSSARAPRGASTSRGR